MDALELLWWKRFSIRCRPLCGLAKILTADPGAHAQAICLRPLRGLNVVTIRQVCYDRLSFWNLVYLGAKATVRIRTWTNWTSCTKP